MNKDQKLFHVLNDLGVPCGTLGRQYTEDCVNMLVQNDGRYIPFEKGIYYTVAQKNGVCESAIERLIRKVMRNVLKRGNADLINDIFGEAFEAKEYFHVSVFISSIAKYVIIYD